MKKITLFTKEEVYKHFPDDIEGDFYYDCEQDEMFDVSYLPDFPLKFIVSDEVYKVMTDTYMDDINIDVVEKTNPMVDEVMRSVCGKYNFPSPFVVVETINDPIAEEEYNNASKGKSYLVKKMIKERNKSIAIGSLIGFGLAIGGFYMWRKS